jgi:hypothetical protein
MRSVGELISTNEAVATLVAGVDAFRNERKRVSSRLRYINGISVVGSAVINDTAFDLFIEDYYVGRFRNTRGGVVQAIIPDDVQPVKAAACPAGSQLTCLCVITPTTNAVSIKVYGW